MTKDINSSDLKDLLKNHRFNKDLPVYTNWAAFLIEDLEAFLAAVKPRGANAVAISLIRFPLAADGPPSSNTGKPRIKTAGLGLSQVSFAIIPGVSEEVKEPWDLVATKNGDGTIKIMCICEPGTDLNADKAGLCPPQGNEIIFDGP
jgi:hypothetical protein